MRLFTVEQAARMLGVSPINFWRYIASGKLAAVRVGRNVHIAQDDIEQLAAREPEQPHPGLGRVLTEDSPKWRIFGIIEDGPPDLSENHDKYLADAYGDLHDR